MSTATQPRGKETKRDNVGAVLSRALDAGQGLLRLTPTWVPRSFLHPGKRIKLHPEDWYAYGAHRGGIDERWFSSTTEAANDGRVWHEGLSFCEFEGEEFLLRDAVAEAGAKLIGDAMFKKYNRWPVYSKFFDNMGPIPHHMHQGFEDAKLVGQEGKPESYYFPPQLNNVDNNFAYTFMNLGAFAIVAWLQSKGRDDSVDDFSGLAVTAPLHAAAMAVFLFSMTGVPPLLGFYGKYFIIQAAIEANLTWLAIVVVIFSAISAFYYLRLVATMYFGEPQGEPASFPARFFGLGIAVMVVATLTLGILSGPILDLAKQWVF